MKQWLTIIGVGLDGLEGLSNRAQASLDEASIVAGSNRLLDVLHHLTFGDVAVP